MSEKSPQSILQSCLQNPRDTASAVSLLEQLMDGKISANDMPRVVEALANAAISNPAVMQKMMETNALASVALHVRAASQVRGVKTGIPQHTDPDGHDRTAAAAIALGAALGLANSEIERAKAAGEKPKPDVTTAQAAETLLIIAEKYNIASHSLALAAAYEAVNKMNADAQASDAPAASVALKDANQSSIYAHLADVRRRIQQTEGLSQQDKDELKQAVLDMARIAQKDGQRLTHEGIDRIEDAIFSRAVLDGKFDIKRGVVPQRFGPAQANTNG